MNTVPLRTPEWSTPALERPAPPARAEASFGDTLASAVEKVADLQGAADQEATRLAHGAGNLHETALALEKADVAMRLAVRVRNRLVEAYNEVMRMNL